MTTLDLCLVADRQCPTSRTYLTYLINAGLRLRQVLLVDFLGRSEPLRVARRRFGSWLEPWLKQRQRPVPRDYDMDYRELCGLMQRHMPLQVDYFNEFDFGAIAQHVIRISAEDYDDNALQRQLLRSPCSAFLYTSGGRVPGTLLEALSYRILHVHPGVVPQVKGSDCLLWSLLMRGRPGASCFYMNAGIDTGNIIVSHEFEPPKLPHLKAWIGSAPDRVFAALLHAFDPHLRAQVLLQALALSPDGRDLHRLPARAQSPEEGRSYYWMHPRMYPAALRRLLGPDEP